MFPPCLTDAAILTLNCIHSAVSQLPTAGIWSRRQYSCFLLAPPVFREGIKGIDPLENTFHVCLLDLSPEPRMQWPFNHRWQQYLDIVSACQTSRVDKQSAEQQLTRGQAGGKPTTGVAAWSRRGAVRQRTLNERSAEQRLCPRHL